MILFSGWAWVYGSKAISDSDSAVRFVVCSGIALILLVQPRKKPNFEADISSLMVTAAVGTLLSIIGILFHVNQFIWIGMILMLYTCLRYGLPDKISSNSAIACFMLYWAHPFPSQLEWPLHSIMQQLSVNGSEWLLHIFNIPAWADGTIIHGIAGTFEVPRACSGMRTASTVVICAFGASILFRLGWKRAIILSLLGIVQTLILNIIRISVMVANVNLTTSDASAEFMHDTTGALLLVSILLVQGEAAFWHWRFLDVRNAITRGKRPFAIARTITLIMVLLAALALLMNIERRNKDNRAKLINSVAKSLINTNLTAADKASLQLLELKPDDPTYLITRAKVLRQQNLPHEVLETIEDLPTNDNMDVLAMRLWALNSTGESEQIRTEFAKLPQNIMAHPEVAIVAAEFAASNNNLTDVMKHLPNAAKSPHTVDRVRHFYHYLAANEQWRHITEFDSDLPYADSEELLLGVTARLIIDDRESASSLLMNNRRLWQNDTKFTSHLLAIAEKETSDIWGKLYAACVTPQLATMSADELHRHISPLFRLKQDKLAFKLYEKLKLADPQHPGISLAAARHAQLCPVPEERKAHLGQAIDAFELRHISGKLSPQLTLKYIDALTIAGKPQKASSMLLDLRETNPALNSEIITRQVDLYCQSGQWQQAYETVHKIRSTGLFPERLTANNLIRTLAGMGQPFYGITVAKKALRTSPGWPGIRFSLASILVAYGHSEEALFVISQAKLPASKELIQLYESTSRYKQAYAVRQQLDMPEKEIIVNPSWVLPPAETTVMPPIMLQPKHEKLEKLQLQLKNKIATDTSPFIKKLHQQTLLWYSNDKSADSIETWLAIGRDELERATALHALALLQAQRGQYDNAYNTTARALKETPAAAILHQLAVTLSSGAADTVDQAFQACPNDADLWLAKLITAHKTGADKKTLSAILKPACENHPRYSPGTLVRAAGFLLKVNQPQLAEQLIDTTLHHDNAYVPAYLLGIHTARICSDLPTAIKRANSASELAPNPWPFHRTSAQLQMALSSTDPSVITKLEALKTRFPTETEWRVRLGCIYMEHDDAERAWRVLEPLVKGDAPQLPHQVMIRAAEAARRNGRQQTAVRLLRQLHAKNPDNLRILSNLIFTLAQKQESQNAAAELVPKLLQLENDAATLDTAAFALNAVNKPQDALIHINKALQLIADKPIQQWTGIYITAAEINQALGKTDEARKLTNILIKSTGPVITNDSRVRALLD